MINGVMDELCDRLKAQVRHYYHAWSKHFDPVLILMLLFASAYSMVMAPISAGIAVLFWLDTGTLCAGNMVGLAVLNIPGIFISGGLIFINLPEITCLTLILDRQQQTARIVNETFDRPPRVTLDVPLREVKGARLEAELDRVSRTHSSYYGSRGKRGSALIRKYDVMLVIGNRANSWGRWGKNRLRKKRIVDRVNYFVNEGKRSPQKLKLTEWLLPPFVRVQVLLIAVMLGCMLLFSFYAIGVCPLIADLVIADLG